MTAFVREGGGVKYGVTKDLLVTMHSMTGAEPVLSSLVFMLASACSGCGGWGGEGAMLYFIIAINCEL